MKVVSSLKTLKSRDRNCQVVRRRGRLYVINKQNPRLKARQSVPSGIVPPQAANFHSSIMARSRWPFLLSKTLRYGAGNRTGISGQ